jgi:DNA/RNA endonuclease G (NUC1)
MMTLTSEKPTSVSPADHSNLLPGNPSNVVNSTSSPDNYLMDKGEYVLSYNRDRGEPNWVSWYLGASSLGTTDRSNDSRADTSNLWRQLVSTVSVISVRHGPPFRPSDKEHVGGQRESLVVGLCRPSR